MTTEGRRALDEARVREEARQLHLPWGGRAPRCLTKAYQQFTLPPLGGDADMNFDDDLLDEQYRRFLSG